MEEEFETAKERVEFELQELKEKIEKLSQFIGSKEYCALSYKSQRLLHSQISTMKTYANILDKRLQNWETDD